MNSRLAEEVSIRYMWQWSQSVGGGLGAVVRCPVASLDPWVKIPMEEAAGETGELGYWLRYLGWGNYKRSSSCSNRKEWRGLVR